MSPFDAGLFIEPISEEREIKEGGESGNCLINYLIKLGSAAPKNDSSGPKWERASWKTRQGEEQEGCEEEWRRKRTKKEYYGEMHYYYHVEITLIWK